MRIPIYLGCPCGAHVAEGSRSRFEIQDGKNEAGVDWTSESEIALNPCVQAMHVDTSSLLLRQTDPTGGHMKLHVQLLLRAEHRKSSSEKETGSVTWSHSVQTKRTTCQRSC